MAAPENPAFDLGDGLRQFRDAIAEDLLMLALLHGEELTAARIADLKEVDFPRGLGLVLDGDDARKAADLVHTAVVMLPEPPEQAVLDALAADYADIYLTYKLHASPYESVWIDEDGLVLQEPMFEIRSWYERHGLAAENWRQRSDDHLVLQLQFISHLLRSEEDAGIAQAAQFMDEHLLRWIEEFGMRVANRCGTPFYAGVAAYTAFYVDELRDVLAEILDEPRPSPESIEERMLEKKKAAVASFRDIPLVSVPATEPSW